MQLPGMKRLKPSTKVCLSLLLLWSVFFFYAFFWEKIRLRCGSSRVCGRDSYEDWVGLANEELFSVELFEDRSPEMTEEDRIQVIEDQSNYPVRFWSKTRGEARGLNESCAIMPGLFQVHYNNLYWQYLKTHNGSFFLYGAYLDKRKLSPFQASVRITAMIDRLEPTVETHCQLWFESMMEPVFSKVVEYRYLWWKEWGNYQQGLLQPYFITCPLPKKYSNLVPESVSLVERPCDMAKCNVKVTNNLLEGGVKEDFAVCVKGLNLPHSDFSVRLVEWMELLRHLGANKFFFYNFGVHPNVSKVLEFYHKRGIAEITQITLPAFLPTHPELLEWYLKSETTSKRQNELIHYNDCLYKNMNRYRYITLLDIDEVIMPKGPHLTWIDMMHDIEQQAAEIAEKKMPASFSFRHTYFFDSTSEHESVFQFIPQYMHMFQHIHRSNYTDRLSFVKCFHNPEVVFTVHNHFPLDCFGGECFDISVNTEVGHLQHYRAECVTDLSKKKCDYFKRNTVLDDTIWRHKAPVVAQVSKVLKNQGFLRVEK